MDISEQQLSQFKRYLRDIDTGVITTDHYPNQTQTRMRRRQILIQPGMQIKFWMRGAPSIC